MTAYNALNSIVNYLIRGNVPVFLIACFSLIYYKVDRSFEKKILHYFQAILYTACLLAISDSISTYYMYTSSSFVLIRLFTGAYGYIARPLVIYLLIRIILRDSPKKYRLFWLDLPEILNAVINIIGLAAGWVFSITPENSMVRGPLWWVPFIVSAYYLLMMIVLSVRATYHKDFGEFIIVIFIAFFSIVFTVLEAALGIRLLLNICILVCNSAYYHYLYMQIYKRDHLTGVFDRRKFYIDANSLSTACLLISIDINELKHVNDNYGHAQGDKYLCAVADVLAAAFPKARVYRMGGDEFVIIDKSRQPVHKVTATIEECLDRLGDFSAFAYGYAELLPHENVDLACIKADKMMYENKRKCHYHNQILREAQAEPETNKAPCSGESASDV